MTRKAKKRWRAEIGVGYLSRGDDGEVYQFIERGLLPDDDNYESGNYFKLDEEVPRWVRKTTKVKA